MANYTNQTNISQFLGRALTANEIAALAFILPAIDKWIDRMLESTFSDVPAATHYYDGGSTSIDTRPVQSVTQVKSVNDDGSDSYLYTENTEYVLEPVNSTIKNEVRHRGRRVRFPRGARRIAVTGRFTEYDYTANAVPADIVMAATQLAGGALDAGKQTGNGGNIQKEELEGHAITYDTSIAAFEVMSASNPLLQGMLAARRELFLYSDDDDEDYDY